MRTIGKQTVEASKQDGEDKEDYKNMFPNENYVCDFPTTNDKYRSSPSKDKTTCQP